MLKRLFYTIIALLLISSVIIASGCGGQEEKPSPPEKDAVLTLYGVDPHTLDPAISGDSTSHQYVTQIFSGLFRLNDLLEPEPDIVPPLDDHK